MNGAFPGYFPRLSPEGGNPWQAGANAYGQDLDRLQALQFQGMQQQAQGPASLYDRFMQGYLQKKQDDAEAADREFKQQQMAIQQQRADQLQQHQLRMDQFQIDRLKDQDRKERRAKAMELFGKYNARIPGMKELYQQEATGSGLEDIPLPEVKYNSTGVELPGPTLPGQGPLMQTEEDRLSGLGPTAYDSEQAQALREKQASEATRKDLAVEAMRLKSEERMSAAQQEAARHNRAMEGIALSKAQPAGPFGSTGALSGNDFLATLDKPQQDLVRAVYLGQYMPNKRTKEGQALIQATIQAYPGQYDESKAAARAKMMSSIASGGVLDRTQKSGNMIIGHLASLYDMYDKSDMPDQGGYVGSDLANKLLDKVWRSKNPKVLGDINAKVVGASSEAPTYFRGTSQTAEKDIEAFKAVLADPNTSKTVKKQAIVGLLDMMVSRALPQQEMYTSTMGPAGGQWSILNKNSIAELRRLLPKEKLADIDKYWGNPSPPSWGSGESQPGGQGAKTVVKKFVNRQANQTKLVYSDGSEEVVSGVN